MGAQRFGPRTQKNDGKKGGGPKGGGPNPEKGWGQEGWGAERVGARRVGAERVGARTQKKGGGPKGGGPKGGGPKFRAFFFLLPLPFSFFFSLSGDVLLSFCLSPDVFSCLFFLSLGIFSWNFGGVLVGRDLKCACFCPQAVL